MAQIALATRSTPSGITGPNAYEPSRYVYNRQPLRRFRAKLAAARAGAGLCNLVCAGTSISEGYGATSRPNVASYPVRLAQRMVAAGFPLGGTGLVVTGNNNSTNADGRWAFAASWTQSASTGFGRSSTTAGDAATFTSDFAGTIVEIPFSAPAGPFSITVDGSIVASGVTVTGGTYNTGTGVVTGSGAQAVGVVTITGLASSNHVVVVKPTTTTAPGIHSVGVRNATGLLVHNAGLGSSQTTTWADALTSSWYRSGSQVAVAPYSPDLVILDAPVNDPLNSVATATTQANLVAAVNRYLAIGSDVILLVDPAPQTAQFSGLTPIPDATWVATRQLMYAAADTSGVTLIDATDALGLRTTLVTNSLNADGVHLNDAGYAATADLVFAALLLGA